MDFAIEAYIIYARENGQLLTASVDYHRAHSRLCWSVDLRHYNAIYGIYDAVKMMPGKITMVLNKIKCGMLSPDEDEANMDFNIALINYHITQIQRWASSHCNEVVVRKIFSCGYDWPDEVSNPPMDLLNSMRLFVSLMERFHLVARTETLDEIKQIGEEMLCFADNLYRCCHVYLHIVQTVWMHLDGRKRLSDEQLLAMENKVQRWFATNPTLYQEFNIHQ